MARDAVNFEQVEDSTGRVARLANLMKDAKRKVDEAEAELAKAKDAYRTLEREDLPTLMSELGFKRVVLADGSIIDVVDDVEASISEARREKAHEWLTEHGFSGIIKSAISLEFDRAELDEAKRLAEEIETLSNRRVSMNERIHPSTLKAFIKEQLEAGVAVPFDLFGIHVFSRAKIKSAK